MDKAKNMQLWNLVCKTDPATTKKVRLSGHQLTAINPQSQRKAATEVFGPYGKGWGIDRQQWQQLDCGDTKLCVYSAELWYFLPPDMSEVWAEDAGRLPIVSSIKIMYPTREGDRIIIDDEFLKKAQTDAITKGLSQLGFNADVFLGYWDDSRYVNQRAEEVAAEEKAELDAEAIQRIEQFKKALAAAETIEEFRSCWKATPQAAREQLTKHHQSWVNEQKARFEGEPAGAS